MSNGSVAPEVEAPRSEAELGARRAAAATDHVARWWPWLAAVLSGAMVTAAFPPWNQGWLIWIALTPLLCAVWFGSAGARRPALRQAQLGWVAGFVFIVSTFYWLGTTLSALYKNPLLLAIPPLIGLYMGLYFAGWAWFVGTVLSARDATNKFPNSWRNLAIGLAGAAAWVPLEWTRGWLFGGFGWNGLGVALHRDLAMIQIADITGVWGLTWLIVFANLMAVIIVRRMIGELGPTFLKRVRWEFSISMAIIVLVFSYGVRRLIRQETGPTVPLRVAAIQPNIPQVEKFDPLFEEKVIDTLDRLTGLAMLAQPAPQLVLWPEASTPRPLYADEKTYQFVKGQGRRSEFALLVGSLDFDPGTSDDYNIAALFTDSGEKTQIYRKMHLVPFGEYLPLRAVFGGFLGEMVPGDFTAGREAKVLELTEPAVKLAPLVCFEDTLGELTNRFVRGGAQLLVNITNDGWFGTSPAAEQHLANAIFRTVETRRPLVRCGNTGVTGSVDSFGRLVRVDQSAGRPTPETTLPMLRPFEEGFVSGELQLPTDLALTFYVRHGDWLPRLGAVVTGLILVGHGWRGFRRRRAA